MKLKYLLNKNKHKCVAFKWTGTKENKRFFSKLFSNLQKKPSPQDKLKKQIHNLENKQIDKAGKTLSHRKAENHDSDEDDLADLEANYDNPYNPITQSHAAQAYEDAVARHVKSYKLKSEKASMAMRIRQIKLATTHSINNQINDNGYNGEFLTLKSPNTEYAYGHSPSSDKVEPNPNEVKKLVDKEANDKHKSPKINSYMLEHNLLYLYSEQGTKMVKPNQYIVCSYKYLVHNHNPDNIGLDETFPIINIYNKQSLQKNFKPCKLSKNIMYCITQNYFNYDDEEQTHLVRIVNDAFKAELIAEKLQKKYGDQGYDFSFEKVPTNKNDVTDDDSF